MSSKGNVTTQKASFSLRAVAGLVLFALAAACDSPTAPTRNPPAPSQTLPEPSRNWPDISGTYTLTLSASSRCASELPEAVRTRTYTATIAQTGGALTVMLSGPDGLLWDRFQGAVGENAAVLFQLYIWEDVSGPGGQFAEFAASGRLTATIAAGGLSGSLDGSMNASVLVEGGRGAGYVRCTAPDHRAVFSR